MSEWLYVTNRETGGSARLPDQPGVRERYEALGWIVGDPVDVENQTWVPPKLIETNEEDGWVTLYHPKTGASHEFPVHPDAIQGAYDAGWQASVPKVSEPDPVPAAKAPDKTSTKKVPVVKADPAADEGE